MILILANNYEIPYTSDDGLNFYADRLTLAACNADEAQLIPANLAEIELVSDQHQHLADLTGLVLTGTEELPVYGADEVTINSYRLVIHLREKTDVELLTERVEALEESRDVQDGAIEDLGEAVSGLYEEV